MEFLKLVEKWKKVGDVYEVPDRVGYRLEHFITHCVPLLSGKKVVEIGCNAGAFGLEIAKVAETYTGIEPGNKIREKKTPPKTDYFKQLTMTKEFVNKETFSVYNDTITEFVARNLDFNAFVAVFAIYHFRDNELALLRKHVFPKCDIVIIQNRNQKRPTQHNSYKFYKDKNIVKFFELQGFTCKVINEVSKKGKIFSEIICTK